MSNELFELLNKAWIETYRLSFKEIKSRNVIVNSENFTEKFKELKKKYFEQKIKEYDIQIS